MVQRCSVVLEHRGDIEPTCAISTIEVMGGTMGTGTFKPEKNLVFSG